jgi:isopentenyldiphosphate isomerase
MGDDSAGKQANSVDSHPVTPKSQEQVAERRRRIEDALEDDEVREALSLLHAQKKAKNDD